MSDLKKEIIDAMLLEQDSTTQMLSKTTHDLNNSLAVFLGQVSILELLNKKQTLTPEKIDSIAGKLLLSVDKFKEKIEGLKTYYKVPQQDEEYTTIESAIKALDYFFANQIYKKEIEYKLEISDDIKELDLNPITTSSFLYIKLLIQESISSICSMEKASLNIAITQDQGKVSILIEDNRENDINDSILMSGIEILKDTVQNFEVKIENNSMRKKIITLS